MRRFNRKATVLVSLFSFGVLLASCGTTNTAEAPSKLEVWTQGDVDAVKDLSELGEMTYTKFGQTVVGGKLLNPKYVTTQFYGKERDFVDLKKVAPLVATKGLNINDLSPSELEDIQIAAIKMNTLPPKGWKPLQPLASYSIASSYTDVYKLGCSSGIKSMRNRAATQSNLSSYYLAVDSSLYKGSSLLDKRYKSSYGPISGVTVTASASVPGPLNSCNLYQSFKGQGWHKGKQSVGSLTTKSTYDSGNF